MTKVRRFSEELATSVPTNKDRLETLYNDWLHCTRCPLGQYATQHCLYDRMPSGSWTKADIMILGEGPGEAENAIGRPFVGPSGQLLRRALTIARAQDPSGALTILLTNLVACRPFDKTTSGRANRAPSFTEAATCSPRLFELLAIFRPHLLVTVGRVPDDFLLGVDWEGLYYPPIMKTLDHPAYVLRKGTSQAFESYTDHWHEVVSELMVYKESMHEHKG